MLLLFVVAGCASEGQSSTRWSEEGAQLFQEAPGGRPASDSEWRIVIATFRGPDAAQLAERALVTARRDAGLPEAYIAPAGEAVVIAYGHYEEPTGERAQEDLRRIRSMVIQGQTPFAGAFLLPPAAHEPAPDVLSPLDLRSVRRVYAPELSAYTLEVGVYRRDDAARPSERDLRQFRQSAEEAARRLRADGEEAYFHHGPNSSSVTIGVFAENEVEVTDNTRFLSGRIRQLMLRHPRLLVNGVEVRKLRPGVPESDPRAITYEPTRLVAIPDS